jgi:putative ABC transport system substrate-binding protein
VIERRYADGHPERLSALAMELVRLDVAVLLAPGAVVTRAARSATERIPIVSVTNDPVALGFAQSLASPGGNVTGLAITASDQLVEKWVELLKDVRPALKRAALLYDPRPAPMIERVAHNASATIGIEIIPFRVTDAEELGATLAAIERGSARRFAHQQRCATAFCAEQACCICKRSSPAGGLRATRIC